MEASTYKRKDRGKKKKKNNKGEKENNKTADKIYKSRENYYSITTLLRARRDYLVVTFHYKCLTHILPLSVYFK